MHMHSIVSNSFDLLFYSTPAPGYFDEDDVLDFMVHWSTGAWPMYNASQVTSPNLSFVLL